MPQRPPSHARRSAARRDAALRASFAELGGLRPPDASAGNILGKLLRMDIHDASAGDVLGVAASSMRPMAYYAQSRVDLAKAIASSLDLLLYIEQLGIDNVHLQEHVRGLEVHGWKCSNVYHLALRTFIDYQQSVLIANEGEDRRLALTARTKRLNRDTTALRYLRTEGISPLEAVKLAKTGFGVENWRRSFQGRNSLSPPPRVSNSSKSPSASHVVSPPLARVPAGAQLSDLEALVLTTASNRDGGRTLHLVSTLNGDGGRDVQDLIKALQGAVQAWRQRHRHG